MREAGTRAYGIWALRFKCSLLCFSVLHSRGIQAIDRLQAGQKTSASEAGRGGRKQSGLTETDYCGNHIHDGSTSASVKI